MTSRILPRLTWKIGRARHDAILSVIGRWLDCYISTQECNQELKNVGEPINMEVRIAQFELPLSISSDEPAGKTTDSVS